MKNATIRVRVSASLAAVASATILLCGCRGGAERTPDVNSHAVVKTAEVPGVTLRLSADSKDLTVSQRVNVQVDIEAKDGIIIAPDSYEKALRESEHRFDFRLVGRTHEESVPTGQGSLRWRYTYELEFVLPDTYELPPATIMYTDTRRDEGQSKAARESKPLETEALTVVVRDTADAHPTQDEMATVATPAPVDLPPDWIAWPWAIPILAALVVIGFWLWRRIRRERSEVPFVMPAHMWAQRELDALAAERLIDQGLIQRFHYRISDIVRGYVERRFDVAAPEMTTEEFLATATADGRFGPQVTGELERFLQTCDIVKYARVDPGPDGPRQLMHTAGDFVERTKADADATSTPVEADHAEEQAV